MSSNRYLEDKTIDDKYREDGLLSAKNLIIGSAIAAGSIAAYRSGRLAPMIKKGVSYASEKKPTVSTAANVFRNWINGEGLDVDDSIFRKKVTETLKDITTYNKERDLTIKEKVKAFSKLDKEKARAIIDATKKDINNYKGTLDITLEMMEKGTKGLEDSYHNLEFLKNLRDIDKAVDMYSTSMAGGKNAMKSKAMDSLFKKTVQTQEEATKSLKRNGFRKATINDLFDTSIDKYGNLKLIEKTDINMSRKGIGELESAKEQLEKALNAGVFSEEGHQLTKDGRKVKQYQIRKNFKDIVLDDNFLIDSDNVFRDLRSQKREIKEMIRNASDDFQIPFIGVNPGRMFGLNKIGKRKVSYGTISEDTVAPFLTGVRGNGKEHTIRNLKDEIDILKGVREGVTIIDGDVYRMNDSGNGIVKMAYKSKKELITVTKDMDRGTNALSPLENALRKMGGISKVVPSTELDEKELKGFKKYTKKIRDILDIGNQEAKVTKLKMGLKDHSNPDAYIEKTISKVANGGKSDPERIKTFSGLSSPYSNGRPKDSFMAINKSMSIKDLAKEKFDSESVMRYVRQYGNGFNSDFENVNRKTAGLFFMLDRMNETISSVGLGLSMKSTSGAYDMGKDLIMKRLLPIYAAYKALDFINVFGEDGTDNGKKPSTIKQRGLKAAVDLDVGVHMVTDKIGLADKTKKIGKLMPGADMLEELPGIKMLNIHQTADERKEYWEKGYDPVRKGRYWSMNNTPFVGGKIQYWKPNAYRSALADAKYSDSQYGSRKERIANAFNPYHYDKKHYYTRPYLMSSSAFENVPLVGPLLSGTVGKVVKPPVKMHSEFWNEDGSVKSQQQVRFERQQDLGYIMNLKELTQESSNVYTQQKDRDSETIARVFGFRNGNIKSSARNSLANVRFSDNSFSSQLVSSIQNEPGHMAVFKTAGGSMRTVNLGSDGIGAKYKINRKGYSLNQIIDAKDDSLTNSYLVTDEQISDAKMGDPSNPYSIENTLKDQYVDSANVAGIYGFGATGFLTGNLGAGDTVIETSGYSRSFARDFWDSDLGGAGGDVSEIFRRFIQKRRSDKHYYNPIRNTQPGWMPGEGSFIDFQHGDPYTKVAHGEERLVGEGYERLHGLNMDNMLQMKVGSSTIGKTKEEIIKHFLHQDSITDPELQDIVDGGTKTHEKIEKEMLASGIAIDAEREIKDEENGIIGYYDLRIHDPSSKTGEAIVDIKTISAKGFEKVKAAGAPKDVHQRQVNWYLHHTNKDNKGYVMYVNRDNPDEQFTVGFDYDKEMYESSMNTLTSAREDVREMMHNGILSRGDLYKPIDRFRILADVAPYSDEYKAMEKQLSAMSLSEEDEAEFRAIKDRATAQREPLRLYDYRFKHADVRAERAKIGKQIDNTTFTLDGGDETIKLAGLKINKSSENYEEAQAFIEKHMKNGKNIKILVADDPLKRRNSDTLNTTSAVVYSDGMNINRELIKRGLAEEQEDDYSPTGVHARFNSLQRTFGRSWETVAHFDSMANTKLLQVRSAAEDYERKHVYNKDFKKWDKPVEDFLKPAIWTNMNRGAGILIGGIVGYAFGSSSSRYGKLVGTLVGATTVGAAKMYKAKYEFQTGERWIPEEKRKERELNEYIDKLKFVKNRKLFEVYAEKAKQEDGIDVKEVLSSSKAQGNARKSRNRKISEAKAEYKKTDKFDIRAFEKQGVKFDRLDKVPGIVKELLTEEGRERIKKSDGIVDAIVSAEKRRKKTLTRTVNKTIEENSTKRNVFELSENAMKAIEYYNASEATMYGYDPGEQLTNFMSALPKAERQYFRHFLEAPEKEREKILSMAPKYMKRALQSSYGMKVDEKEDLASYFSEHYLPGDDWDGWQEGFNLDAMKVKMIQTQGMDLATFDMWEDDKVEADLYGPTAIPNMNYKTRDLLSVKNKMRQVLGDAGYSDLEFSFTFGSNKPTIDLQMYEDKKARYEEKIRERMGSY